LSDHSPTSISHQSPPLDFTVVRQVWNRYRLDDNTILKVMLVLTRVVKVAPQQTDQQPTYSVDFQNMIVALSSDKGQPDAAAYSPEEMREAVTKDDIHFDTQEQEWNEYVVDDGTKIRIQPILLQVSKTSKYDNKGYPLYLVNINATMDVKPPRTQ
jgi:hypothetical protein